MQLTLFNSPAPAIQLQVLGSSSAGNCTVIWDQGHALLVDCGFSPSYIEAGLEALGLQLADLSGAFITHTHADHVNEYTLNALVRLGVPIFCPESIRKPLTHRYRSAENAMRAKLLKPFGSEGVDVGSFTVGAFRVPHDSPGGCFGFTFLKETSSGIKKIAVSTDLGYAEDGILEQFANADIIVLESNHDCDMLENSGRPAWLKRRIRDIGHLSNDQCADLLLRVLGGSSRHPESVVLAHISQECNTNPIAVHCTRTALDERGYNAIRIVPSFKMQPNLIVTVK